MDLTTRIVNAAVEHWPLVAGIMVAANWLLPKAIHQTLSNGGGEIIRRIVRSENAEQTRLHTEELDRRFEKHERQEDERFRTIEDEVFRRRR